MPLTLATRKPAPFSLTEGAQYDSERQALAFVLTPCPPRKRCAVCEGRVNRSLGVSAPPTSRLAKYRHMAENNGAMVARGLAERLPVDRLYALVRKAGSYAALVLEG